LVQFGWRILFISGGVLGIIGLWLRRDLRESKTFIKLQQNIKERYVPLHYVLRYQYHRIGQVFVLLFISACGSYTLMGYLSTYLNQFLNVPLSDAYRMQTLFIIFSLILVPIFAFISDKLGRKVVLIFSIVGYIFCAIPSFYWLQSVQAWWVLLPLVIFYSAEQAVTPALIVEMFPGKGRYTGISIAYNLSMALVGGFSPVINTYLIHYTHNNMIIAYYVLFCAFASLFIVLRNAPQEYGVRSSLTMV
jgi:MHS family proline/betaine transporter-like MFS transporter